MTATVHPIRRSRPGHWADVPDSPDEDNRPTASTGALAFVVVACPFVLLGIAALIFSFFKH